MDLRHHMLGARDEEVESEARRVDGIQDLRKQFRIEGMYDDCNWSVVRRSFAGHTWKFTGSVAWLSRRGVFNTTFISEIRRA